VRVGYRPTLQKYSDQVIFQDGFEETLVKWNPSIIGTGNHHGV